MWNLRNFSMEIKIIFSLIDSFQYQILEIQITNTTVHMTSLLSCPNRIEKNQPFHTCITSSTVKGWSRRYFRCKCRAVQCDEIGLSVHCKASKHPDYRTTRTTLVLVVAADEGRSWLWNSRNLAFIRSHIVDTDMVVVFALWSVHGRVSESICPPVRGCW